MILIISIYLYICLGQWVLIDQNDFTDLQNLEESQWSFQGAKLESCQTNNEKQVVIQQSTDFFEKQFYIDLSEIYFILDLYIDVSEQIYSTSEVRVDLISDSNGTNITQQLFNQTIYNQQIKNLNKICDTTKQYFEQYTIISQNISVNLQQFIIRISYQNLNLKNFLRIKHFLLYGKKIGTMYYPFYCQSFFYYKQFFFNGLGCVNECPRNNFLLNQDKTTCVRDQRIEAKYYYLNMSETQGQLLSTTTISHVEQQPPPQCANLSNEVFGYFNQKRVELTIQNLDQTIILFRIRLNLLLYNFQSQSKILFGLENIIQSYFFQNYTGFVVIDINNNLTNQSMILNQITSMDSCIIQYRLELILMNLQSQNPSVFFIESKMSDSLSLWGFSNFTLDVVVCQLNCLTCFDTHTCSICKQGFFLYQSECIQNCPVHSIITNNNCTDYEEEITNSKYLVKSFYNLNMTIEQIVYHFDFVTNYSMNFLTGQNFTILRNKFVLGGVLVWNNATYSKMFNITNPHYAISLRFNLTFGDDFNGLFFYFIDNVLQGRIERNQNSYGENIIGKQSPENIQHIYNYFSHNLNTLKIEFQCLTSQDISDGFCAISEYFIVVHYNYSNTLINSTDSIINQNSNQESQNNITIQQNLTYSICETPYFWNYNSLNPLSFCSYCNISYYNDTYNSTFNCKSCSFEKNNKFILIQNQCFCDPNDFRELNQNKCQCQEGYEDISTYDCQPICGDTLVVQSEECDDGNLIPYDGCYQCQYQCQIECLLCNKGKCQLCQDNFILLNNNCIQNDQNNDSTNNNEKNQTQYDNICGNGILDILNEECDDQNQNARDGCFNCKIENGYYCFENDTQYSICQRCNDNYCNKCKGNIEKQICIQCKQGYYLNYLLQCVKCKDDCLDCQNNSQNCISKNQDVSQKNNCNNSIGWYYNQDLQICETICGDGIIQGNEQCDNKIINNEGGCNHKCELEKGYLLNTQTNQTIVAPKLIAESQQQDTNNLFLISGDLNSEVINCTDTSLQIDNFNQSSFIFSVNESQSGCIIEIQYSETIQPFNLIHIFIKQKNFYQKRMLQEQDLILQEIIKVPKKQILQSEEKIAQSKQLGKTSKVISSIALSISPLAIFLGKFKYIWQVLDLLSWLNNFYFLNVNYPSIVKYLFLLADWQSVFSFPTISYFNTKDSEYYFTASQRFQDKNVDPLFINNIQTILFFFLQIIVAKFFCQLFIKFFDYRYKQTTQNHIGPKIFKLGLTIFKRTLPTQKEEIPVQQQVKIPKLLRSFYIKCQECQIYFVANLLKVLQINFLDLTLAVTLQLSYQQTAKYIIVSINIIFAYVTSILLIILLIFNYQISNSHKLKLENKYFKTLYGCFYEEVQINSRLSMLYSFVNLIRKVIFIVSTVYFYQYPIYQTGFCFLSSLLSILILFNHNPFENKQQYFLVLIPDFSILIINGLSIIYAFQDTFNNFDDDTIENSGWIIVLLIYISIGIQFLFLVKQLTTDIYQNIKKLLENCKSQSQNKQL